MDQLPASPPWGAVPGWCCPRRMCWTALPALCWEYYSPGWDRYPAALLQGVCSGSCSLTRCCSQTSKPSPLLADVAVLSVNDSLSPGQTGTGGHLQRHHICVCSYSSVCMLCVCRSKDSLSPLPRAQLPFFVCLFVSVCNSLFWLTK